MMKNTSFKYYLKKYGLSGGKGNMKGYEKNEGLKYYQSFMKEQKEKGLSHAQAKILYDQYKKGNKEQINMQEEEEPEPEQNLIDDDYDYNDEEPIGPYDELKEHEQQMIQDDNNLQTMIDRLKNKKEQQKIDNIIKQNMNNNDIKDYYYKKILKKKVKKNISDSDIDIYNRLERNKSKNKNENISKLTNIFNETIQENKKMNFKELKAIAKKEKIKLSHMVDGKRKPLNKKQLLKKLKKI